MPEENHVVKIVRLEPMRVASVNVLGQTPEREAWERMKSWAKGRGFLDLSKNPVFGFNNPDPAPGQSFHGYEYWMKLDSDTEISGEVIEKHFDGGLYAVIVCAVNDPWKDIPKTWGRLLHWVQQNGYTIGTHQYFEVPEDPDAADQKLVLHLYCPIVKK